MENVDVKSCKTVFIVFTNKIFTREGGSPGTVGSHDKMAEWRDLVKRLTKKHKGKPLAAILVEARKQYSKMKKNTTMKSKSKRNRNRN
jgi:hypothetical protein